ncbi:MAG TPA: tRNA 2-thiouridine(34) synthase MnmA [Deinococcales bacterium]|nr:tRNA 2-thiouridine(34) synthase MnmA [Deinococcales bacterium]
MVNWGALAGRAPGILAARDALGEQLSGRVLVAMSGGVDSSVSAALLRDAGYEVIGAMMRFWPDEKPVDTFNSCCSPDAAYEARRVAEALDIPFYLLDYREVFEREIINPWVAEYAAGRTPNPCVLCNTRVKFDRLAQRAAQLGCDFVATGHYVSRVDGPRGVEFHRGLDDRKDQTYFLWGTPRNVLDRILFPVGELSKPRVRELAREYGLITAEKPESQSICFVPGSTRDFLAGRLPGAPGDVLDPNGKVVGRHEGAQFYTVGQKKALGLFHTHEPMFVTRVDVPANVVHVGPREACEQEFVRAARLNWLLDPEDLPERVQAQVRYRQQPAPAVIESLDETGVSLRFETPQFAVTPGQSLVVYDGARLLGGGFISSGFEAPEPALAGSAA